MLKSKYRKGQRVLYYGEEKKILDKLLMRIADSYYWYYRLEDGTIFTLERELKKVGA